MAPVIKRFSVPIFVALLVLSLGCLFFHFLPGYLERHIFPAFFKHVGLTGFNVDVRSIGISGSELGRVVAGDPEDPWLSIDSVLVTYSAPDVMRKEISSIVLDGLRLETEFDGNRFIIPALQDLKSGGTATSSGQPFALPVSFGRLLLRNGTLIVAYRGRKIFVPFAFEARQHASAKSREKGGVIDGELTCRPAGQKIRLQATLDQAAQRLDFTIAADGFSLAPIAALAVDDLTEFFLAGRADLHGKASVHLAPFHFLQMEASCTLSGVKGRYRNLVFTSRKDQQQEEAAMRLLLQGNEEKVHIQVSNLPEVSRLPVALTTVDLDIRPTPEVYTISGKFAAEPRLSKAGERPVGAEGFRAMHIDFDGQYSPQEQIWQWHFFSPVAAEGRERRVLSLPWDAYHIGADAFDFSAAVKGAGAPYTADYTLQVSGLSLDAGGVMSAAVQTLRLSARTVFEEKISTHFDLQVHELTGGRNSVTGRGEAGLAGTLETFGFPGREGSGQPSFAGTLSVRDFLIEDAEHGIAAKNISWELPLKWPMPTKPHGGELNIGHLLFDQQDLGTVAATVHQLERGVALKGLHSNTLLDRLSMQFAGEASWGVSHGLTASVQFNSIPGSNRTAAPLGRLHPSLRGFSYEGGFSFNGKILFDSGALETDLSVAMQNATLAAPDRKLRVEGLNTVIDSPDLLTFRSRPKQHLSFARASFGDFAIEKGMIDFQVEAGKSLLIEKSGCNWAGGRLYTPAFRITADKDQYEVTLFCDRLKLALLLEQFGAANAVSNGEVNGRIPLLYADGKIEIGEGFLYSTPGEGGVINVSGADALTAGIPKNSQQFSQIDFAMEALKHFNYQWVKLTTATEQEDLILKLQLEGKPAARIPFEYDNRSGLFVRVEPGTAKGIERSILLDVNFRLPLNRFLDYGTGINKVMEKMK